MVKKFFWIKDPEQAVQIHMDVKSQKSIAIHWGTFALASEVILSTIIIVLTKYF